MLLAHSLPVAGAGSQNSVGCETARARPRWVFRALSKPSCGGSSRPSWLLGGLASPFTAPAQASASPSQISFSRQDVFTLYCGRQSVLSVSHLGRWPPDRVPRSSSPYSCHLCMGPGSHPNARIRSGTTNQKLDARWTLLDGPVLGRAACIDILSLDPLNDAAQRLSTVHCSLAVHPLRLLGCRHS